MRSISLAGLAVSVVLLAAGCSGGGDATTTVSTEAPVTTVLATTPSTTEPPATSSSTTTTTIESTTTTVSETTTTTTTTLPVPPRLTFPDDPEKQAVVDAAYAFYDAANAAARNPTGALERAALEEVAEEPIESRLLAFLDELVADRERVVGQPGTSLDIYAITVAISGASATLDTCSTDADVRVRSDGGQDVIVDDSIASWNQTYQLVERNGAWHVADITRFASFEGQLGCGEG